MNRSSPKIHLASDLGSYFETELSQIARKQGIEVSPFAAKYLAKVLEKFTHTKNYLVENKNEIVVASENAKPSFPTLATLWLESLTLSPSEQYLIVQHLGDVALFTSGFLSDKIKGSVVDMDYYIAMGGQAYERAGVLRESSGAERTLNVFFELASSFQHLVEVFAEFSDQALLCDEKSLIRLYEKWLANRSDRIARMLAEKGIIAAGKVEE